MSLLSVLVAHIRPHKTEVIIPVKDVIKEGVVGFEAERKMYYHLRIDKQCALLEWLLH